MDLQKWRYGRCFGNSGELSHSGCERQENREQPIVAGAPGLDDTDKRNEWLCTQCLTSSTVYEAIEFLESLGRPGLRSSIVRYLFRSI